jgi:hypothetical protein
VLDVAELPSSERQDAEGESDRENDLAPRRSEQAGEEISDHDPQQDRTVMIGRL